MRVPQFFVHSNVHMTNLDSAINRLLVNESLIDVTLACDGHKFQCHRLVLAASSPLFEELLKEHPKDHPIVIIPIGVKWHILKSLIDFMYKGQTFVNQAELKTLIESAELLQVIGLYNPTTQFREYYADGDDAVNSLDGEDEEQQVHLQNIEMHANLEKEYQPEENADNTGNTTERESNNVEMTTLNGKSAEVIVDFIEIDDSQDAFNPADGTTSLEESQHQQKANETDVNGVCDDNISSDTATNTSPLDPNLKAKKENNTDETTVEDTKLIESDILQNVPNSSIPELQETMPTTVVTPGIKLINLFKINRLSKTGENQSPSKIPWTYIHIPSTLGSNIKLPSTQTTTAPTIWCADALPKLTPAVISKPVQGTDSASAAVPSFLKFNSSSMAISVKNLDRTKTQQKLNVLNMALETETEHEQREQDLEEGVQHDNIQEQEQHTVESMNSVLKHEIEVKTESMDFDSGELYLNHNDFPYFYDILNKDRCNRTMEAGDEAENIICQPNVSYIYDGDDYGKDVEYVDDDEVGVCIDYDRLVAETYGNMPETQELSQNGKKKSTKKFKKSIIQENLAEENDQPPSSLYPYYSSILLPESNGHQRLKDPPTLVPLSVMNAGLGPKHLYFPHNKINSEQKLTKDFNKNHARCEPTTSPDSHLSETASHTKNSVILRNPRCNQPRHYSNESLYAALMAVKYGDSIYRASRLHSVPRKTLRNWMKRWDIKSQYPMPKQLKDAAKKKKLNQIQST